MESDAIVPPMRARAVSSWTGSTVATIAFSSGTLERMDDEGLGDRRQGRRHGGGEQKGKAHERGPQKGA